MKIKAALLICMFLFLNCDSNKHNFDKELRKENLVKLELKELKISILVPQESSFDESNNEVLINLNPKGRSVKLFSIKKATAPKNNKYNTSFTFDSGATLNYFIFEENGGNGGIEYKLNGNLEYEDRIFKITSTYQEELGRGYPEFCLKYLSTIKNL
ncbi:hypothetical protein [Aquimarina mytili]|uniref:Type six secretion immunity 3 domain-containing protein n=1 Tax=Aquimarina mytili TaxID=874423 RepID=A0A936ZXH7_9FLAO|nr:hypothetical protein [Aquimarina mytili]MBL0686122.1 hypothetical protein [Aquimarina mytili]